MNVLKDMIEMFRRAAHGGVIHAIADKAEAELDELIKQNQSYLEWHLEQGKTITELRQQIADQKELIEAARNAMEEMENHRVEYSRRSETGTRINDKTTYDYWRGRRDEAGHFRDRLSVIFEELDVLK